MADPQTAERKATCERVKALNFSVGVVGAGRVGRKICGELASLGCDILTFDENVPDLSALIQDDMRSFFFSEPVIADAARRIHIARSLAETYRARTCMIIATLDDLALKRTAVARVAREGSPQCFVLLCVPDPTNTELVDAVVADLRPVLASRVIGFSLEGFIFGTSKVSLTAGRQTQEQWISKATNFFAELGKTSTLHSPGGATRATIPPSPSTPTPTATTTATTSTTPTPTPTPAQPPQPEECVICLDNPRELAIAPCGHRCICAACAPSVRQCPMCRGPVTATLKIFEV